MAFSKSFPKTIEGSAYPKWEEMFLSDEEENNQEVKSREENIGIMKGCIDDAKSIVNEKDLKRFETVITNIAIALFEKRASHVVYWKESKCKEKFDMLNK